MGRISQGFLLIASSQILTVLGGFGINVFLSRFLGKELYGQYSLVITGILTIGLNLIASGIPQTLSKFVSEEKRDIKILSSKLLFYQFIESIFLVLIYCSLSPLFAFTLKEAILLQYIIIASLIIPMQGLVSFLIGLYNGLQNFKVQSLLVSLLSILKLVLVIVFSIFWGVKGAILGFLASTFLVSLTFLFLSREFYGRVNRLQIPKEIVQYILKITVFSIELSLLLSMDVIFLKYLLKENQNELIGIYNAGAVLSKSTYFVIISFSGVMFPIISNLIANKKNEEAKIKIGQMIKLSSFILIPMIMLLSSLSPLLVKFLYGIDYSNAAKVTPILAFGYSIIGFFVIFSNILNSIGQTFKVNILSLVIILLDMILLWVFIMNFSITGAAIATTISGVIGFILVFLVTFKKIGITVEIWSIIRINTLAILLFGVLNFILNKYIFNIFLFSSVVIVEFIVYLVILSMTGDIKIKKVSDIFKNKN
ncbi:MAG: oligosaccharide flippase family protein [Candidatus Heimdallarchaeaceae archaeon]